jgi:hypothetical protein
MGTEKGQLEHKKTPAAWVSAIAYCPDGKIVAGSGPDGGICFWDVRTGRVIRELGVSLGNITAIAFSPDGTMVAAAVGRKVHVWEIATGKDMQRLDADDPVRASYGRYGLAFSPNSTRLAAGGATVRVWDLPTGNLVHQLDVAGFFVAFSPDGSTLVATGTYYPPQPIQRHRLSHPIICFWDVRTGRERHVICHHERGDFRCLALSPDGRTLVTGGPGHDVRLWEVASGKERWRLGGHDSNEFTAAFSRDGRILATSASGDGQVRIWDFLRLPLEELPTRKPSAEELDVLWAALGSHDARKGYHALCGFAQWPEVSVSFLEKRMFLLAVLDPRRLSQLLADLDSEQFTVRQKAAEELESMGTAAVPGLEKALESNPSLEVRRRLEPLLEKISGFLTDANALRAIRGVEILEHLGTSEARRVLAGLAQGPAEAPLTREGKMSLQRLATRPAATLPPAQPKENP